jgi:hypothetical protein
MLFPLAFGPDEGGLVLLRWFDNARGGHGGIRGRQGVVAETRPHRTRSEAKAKETAKIHRNGTS